MNTYLPEGIAQRSAQNYECTRSYTGLVRAMEEGRILEAPAVLADGELNLHVSLGEGIRGIIPRDEAAYIADGGVCKDIAILTRVGKPVCFKVTGFSDGEDGERIAFLSRRAAQEECAEHYVSTLTPGDIIPSRVTHLENFGAFVDIGCGIVSLLSIDCICVSRISHPSVRLCVGESLPVVVKSIDERGRIYVSRRELLGTWEENAALFSEGQTVRGTVRSVESYGIFVELTPNLAGLAEVRPDVRPGDQVAVYIKSILPDKMKIKLVLIDVCHTSEKREPPRLFIDTEQVCHIDAWDYSPTGSARRIVSVFR